MIANVAQRPRLSNSLQRLGFRWAAIRITFWQRQAPLNWLVYTSQLLIACRSYLNIYFMFISFAPFGKIPNCQTASQWLIQSNGLPTPIWRWLCSLRCVCISKQGYHWKYRDVRNRFLIHHSLESFEARLDISNFNQPMKMSTLIDEATLHLAKLKRNQYWV